jgi:hypothetical protein
VAASQYTDEEYYLLRFLSGLNDEIANAVILYNPTTLKEAYKLARRVGKSLESHSKMLKPLNKSYFHTSFQQNPLNLVMILFYIYLLFRPNHLINELLII